MQLNINPMACWFPGLVSVFFLILLKRFEKGAGLSRIYFIGLLAYYNMGIFFFLVQLFQITDEFHVQGFEGPHAR